MPDVGAQSTHTTPLKDRFILVMEGTRFGYQHSPFILETSQMQRSHLEDCMRLERFTDSGFRRLRESWAEGVYNPRFGRLFPPAHA